METHPTSISFTPFMPTDMTPATLRTCGKALYGSRWIAPLAAAFPCSQALIHAMLNEQRAITDRTAERVRELLAERRVVIDSLLAA